MKKYWFTDSALDIDMDKGSKFLTKLWCCIESKYYKITLFIDWFDNVNREIVDCGPTNQISRRVLTNS